MTPELLATCWTHAGDSLPVDGRRAGVTTPDR